MGRTALVRRLFDGASDRLARDVTPVLAPLAAHFVNAIEPHAHDHALDVGTGDGLLVRLLAPRVRHVTGIDLSARMLVQRRRYPVPANSLFTQADLLHLPIRPGSFSLVTAAFTLNTTDPNASLRPLRRALAPGGRLAILEWGPRDAARSMVAAALDRFAVEEPGPDLAELRAAIDADPPLWDRYVQDVDDYADRLEALGFVIEQAEESAPVGVPLEVERFLRFALAGTESRAEIRAMPSDVRSTFFDEMTRAWHKLAQPDGQLVWQPTLIRVCARRVR